MEIALKYHTTKEIFEMEIAGDSFVIEIERLDPRIHPLEKSANFVGTNLFKVVDGKLLPFDNKIFVNEIVPFLFKNERHVFMKNIPWFGWLIYYFKRWW